MGKSNDIYDFYAAMWNSALKSVRDDTVMSVPQSPDQIRRDWYKTLKTEELWNLHDELLGEIRRRSE